MDVRSITKTISYLNDKLDMIGALTEPRENAFLRYQDCMDSWFDRNLAQSHQLQSQSQPLECLDDRITDDLCLNEKQPTGHSDDVIENITSTSLVVSGPAVTSSDFNSVSICDLSDVVYHCPSELVTTNPPVAHFCAAPVNHSGVDHFITSPQIFSHRVEFKPESSSIRLQSANAPNKLQHFSILDIARCLAGFGRLVVSTTYPALCTAVLPNDLSMHLQTRVNQFVKCNIFCLILLLRNKKNKYLMSLKEIFQHNFFTCLQFF